MTKHKVDFIMLIDDDEATVYLIERVIKKTDAAEKTLSFYTGEVALEYFQSVKLAKDIPDIILLDINMPGMTGWDFLDELLKVDLKDFPFPKIFMLTTSLNLEDREKAAQIESISDFYNKPLSKEALSEILERVKD